MTDIEIKLDRRFVVDITEGLPLPETFNAARAQYEAEQEQKRKETADLLDEYLLNVLSDVTIQKGGE